MTSEAAASQPRSLGPRRRCLALAAASLATVAVAFSSFGGGFRAVSRALAHPFGGDKSAVRLRAAELVELEELEPKLVTKVLVPLSLEIARWWQTVETEMYVKLIPCLSGGPHVHLQVWGQAPFELEGRRVDGIHSVMYLPPGTVIQECQVDWVQLVTELPQLDELGGRVRALHVACPLDDSGPYGGAAGRGLRSGFVFKVLFTWLLLPWPVLLLPLALWSLARPMLIMADGCLRRFAQRATRRQRVWRFRSLVRRASYVACAFGQGEPCCICLGETAQEGLIALLPCRHAMHDACYSSWICTDSYPSSALICPLCRCPAKAVGKLSE